MPMTEWISSLSGIPRQVETHTQKLSSIMILESLGTYGVGFIDRPTKNEY